jgi:hypothetical protein
MLKIVLIISSNLTLYLLAPAIFYQAVVAWLSNMLPIQSSNFVIIKSRLCNNALSYALQGSLQASTHEKVQRENLFRCTLRERFISKLSTLLADHKYPPPSKQVPINSATKFEPLLQNPRIYSFLAWSSLAPCHALNKKPNRHGNQAKETQASRFTCIARRFNDMHNSTCIQTILIEDNEVSAVFLSTSVTNLPLVASLSTSSTLSLTETTDKFHHIRPTIYIQPT